MHWALFYLTICSFSQNFYDVHDKNVSCPEEECRAHINTEFKSEFPVDWPNGWLDLEIANLEDWLSAFSLSTLSRLMLHIMTAAS